MSLEPLQISPNHRFIITKSGKPFFWLADTAWELFHRLNRIEAENYLERRRQQGFNVIQAVILAEMDGLRTPNINGHIPLLGDDPRRPNEFYFRYVDEIIQLAAEKDLYVGLLPTWGDKVNRELWGIGPVVFDLENAKVYGKFLGERYKSFSNILWILGGDRPAEGYEAIWSAMADGIVEGLGQRPFFTYHPWGGASSSTWFHDADWLDMHMLQSGHVLYDAPNWEMITADYRRALPKPVLDGEPNYEDHPVDPYARKWQTEYGRFTAYDVRKQAYRSVFAGACGHTYGHHSVWQFWGLQREAVTHAMPPWDEAIFREGATQMIHLKNLMLSRPYLSRIPDQEMLIGEPIIPHAGKGEHYHPLRAAHPRATRCQNGTFAMIYIPNSAQTVTLDLSKLSGKVSAWWYDPRNGKSYLDGEYSIEDQLVFTSPIAGPDWVLVFDHVREGFSAPGIIL